MELLAQRRPGSSSPCIGRWIRSGAVRRCAAQEASSLPFTSHSSLSSRLCTAAATATAMFAAVGRERCCCRRCACSPLQSRHSQSSSGPLAACRFADGGLCDTRPSTCSASSKVPRLCGRDLEVVEPEAPFLNQSSETLRQVRRLVRRGEHETVARAMLSLNDKLSKEAVQALAQELLTLGPEDVRALIRAMRLRDVQPDHAVEIFRFVEPWFRQQCPNNDQWGSVLYSLVLDGRLDEAMDIVLSMESGEDLRLPKPDCRIYTILVKAVAKERGIHAAVSFLSRMSVQGISKEGVFFLMMTVACASAEPPEMERAKFFLRKGEELMRAAVCDFRFLRRHDLSFFYNTLMAGYTRQGNLREAFTVLGCMRQRGIRPSAITFHILQHACRFRLDAATEVRQLLRLMEQLDIDPQTGNYNTLVACYAQSGQLTSALQVANRMREAGFPWDGATYLSLINGVVSADQVELALRLLSKMRRDGVRPRASHYIQTFLGLAAAGFYEDACRMFRRVTSIKGVSNQRAYNLMIAIHCKQEDMSAALDVQEQMHEAGMPSDIMTYRILLEAYVGLNDWESALALQSSVQDLRRNLETIAKGGSSTPAAQMAAKQQLQKVKHWTRAYYELIEAAVYNAEWSRGVRLVQELVKLGLPADPAKHARLLEDVEGGCNFIHSAYKGVQQSEFVEASEERKVRLRADYMWAQEVPNVHVGIVPASSSQTSEASASQSFEEEQIRRIRALPPHIFSASFYPGWLNGSTTINDSEFSHAKLWERFRARVQQSSSMELESENYDDEVVESYWVLYAYHHATVHRRPLVSLSLPAKRPLVGRVLPESLNSLRELFTSMGWPGMAGSAIYVFMMPASASLDALLAILAAAAAHPESVYLLRSQDEGGMAALSGECRHRKNRPLSFSLASTLKKLSSALLVNSRLLITNSEDVMMTTCPEFDQAFRASLVERRIEEEDPTADASDSSDEEEDDDPDKPEKTGSASTVWVKWLRTQRLHQMIRYDGTRLRLDGVMHRPALSEEGFFRVRNEKDQVSVDLPMPEEKEGDGPSSLFAWF
eukprot:TRINITY_DN47773_c0_g1_i1.p1 TRINITY_DN47773_c0_g1~~TRINITY_DN47773_c0_g1_i1.p1  ORF type:complete len:1091 (-),score=226.73 TRINITY_DN47773_c0_g1_i1:69-3233(-)